MNNREEVVAALDRADAALADRGGINGTGFWRAVGALRRDPTLAGEFAERAGRIDKAAFEVAVKLRVPAALGTTLLAGVSAAALLAAWWSANLGDPLRTLGFLAAGGVLDISTHSLAHWLVGRLFGIRFTYYFIGGPPPPRPGAKVDYASYLVASPASRAVMHASGAVVTKLVPFVMLGWGAAVGVAWWGLVLLGLVGVVQIFTDVVFSVKTSDWKKVRRELAAAKSRARG